MEGRLRIDLFAFALGALALLGVAFFETRNGAALVMCALCFAGLLAGRFAGFSNRALVPVAIGLLAILWMIWVDETFSGPQMSMIAHGLGGALIGWALSEYLRVRISWPQWGLVALVAVFGLTVLWELGEYMGDTRARHLAAAGQDRLRARHLLRHLRRRHDGRPRLAPGAADRAAVA